MVVAFDGVTFSLLPTAAALLFYVMHFVKVLHFDYFWQETGLLFDYELRFLNY